MPNPDVAREVRDALSALKGADLRDPRLGEVLELASQMSGAMQAFFGALDRTLYDELRYISAYIRRTRQEIAALRPNDIREDRIPGAGAELDAVVRHTAEATHAIMTAAEAVMAADSSDPASYQALVSERMLDIFEACTFQDITGQRIRKVVDTLTHIEGRIERFAKVMGVQDDAPEAETPEARRKRELLLNGPSLGGPEVAQSHIDAMFGTAGQQPAGEAARMDQSALDALFD